MPGFGGCADQKLLMAGSVRQGVQVCADVQAEAGGLGLCVCDAVGCAEDCNRPLWDWLSGGFCLLVEHVLHATHTTASISTLLTLHAAVPA